MLIVLQAGQKEIGVPLQLTPKQMHTFIINTITFKTPFEQQGNYCSSAYRVTYVFTGPF